MPKLILRCNYLKNSPPAHLANYINYIGTREGVEKVGSTTSSLPATDRQKSLIEDILAKIPDANRMHEYHDYIQRPTRENASEFITQALENNLDIIAKKKNYMDYLANRPGVEIIGTHGLFSNEGEPVVLSRVAEEVANHPGVIWTNVISLRREDAERLGYDSAAQWQALLRSRVQLLCENCKIDSRNLKWYAAFHNESHHPHVHLVVYSSDPSEGYLTAKGIDAMRSAYAHDIFRQEFLSIYEKATEQRNQLKEQAEKSLLFLLQQMQEGVCHNLKIAEQMQLLSRRLKNTGGKKVYGYLKADVKAIVNDIVDDLIKSKSIEDWERYAQIIVESDPYDHLRSIHNGNRFYDHTKSWITHCSIQRSPEGTSEWRKSYGKPIVIDEMLYEGNIQYAWGNISPQELVRRFWEALCRGGYGGHGETYIDDKAIWWSHGGEL